MGAELPLLASDIGPRIRAVPGCARGGTALSGRLRECLSSKTVCRGVVTLTRDQLCPLRVDARGLCARTLRTELLYALFVHLRGRREVTRAGGRACERRPSVRKRLAIVGCLRGDCDLTGKSDGRVGVARGELNARLRVQNRGQLTVGVQSLVFASGFRRQLGSLAQIADREVDVREVVGHESCLVLQR